jgi:hypothetical protein
MDNILIPAAADSREMDKMTLFQGGNRDILSWIWVGNVRPTVKPFCLAHYGCRNIALSARCLLAGLVPQNSLSDSLRDISLGP